jgi:hypothetical protein
MCLTRFAHLDLNFPFFIAICMLRFFIAICILRRALCVQYAYCDAIDTFLLNQKGLESMSILLKNFCNMHIARHNMHIAIESILPLTHTLKNYYYSPASFPNISCVAFLQL